MEDIVFVFDVVNKISLKKIPLPDGYLFWERGMFFLM